MSETYLKVKTMKIEGCINILENRFFTLIELLLVSAIIAMLVSLLLPALNRAKDYGKSISCLNNQKQIMIANFSYANDNDGFLVPANWGISVNSGGTHWFFTLGAQYHYINLDVLRCPSDPRPTPFGCLSEVPKGGDVSYGYSRSLGDNYARRNWGGWPDTPDTQFSRFFRPLRLSEFRSVDGYLGSYPSRAIVLFDFVNVEWASSNWVTWNLKLDCSRIPTLRVSARHQGGKDGTYGTANNTFKPLTGSGNFTFVDGHSESRRAPFHGAGDIGNCPDNCDFAGGFW